MIAANISHIATMGLGQSKIFTVRYRCLEVLQNLMRSGLVEAALFLTQSDSPEKVAYAIVEASQKE